MPKLFQYTVSRQKEIAKQNKKVFLKLSILRRSLAIYKYLTLIL